MFEQSADLGPNADIIKAPWAGKRQEYCMNENFEPRAESLRKTVTDLGAQAKEKITAQVQREPAKTFLIILAGSILISVLVGYRLSRMEEESKRQRMVEDWMREVTDWIRQNSRKIATPLRESLEAGKSAVEDVSNAGARRWLPFLEKQKRSFFNLF